MEYNKGDLVKERQSIGFEGRRAYWGYVVNGSNPASIYVRWFGGLTEPPFCAVEHCVNLELVAKAK